VVLPLVVYYQDADGNQLMSGPKMTLAALGCSIGAVICYALCYSMTTERVKVEQKTSKFSMKELVDTLIKNRSLYGIVICALFLLLATLSLSGMASYIFPNYFKSAAGQSLTSVVGVGIVLICALFTTPLAMKFGKKEISVAGAIISVVAFVAAYFIHTDNMMVFIVIYGVAYLGQAFFTLTCWAMITDVIDDIEVKTHERSDGTVYAIYSFARKCGQALASGLTGLLLTIIGYSAATQNDPDVVDGIYNITCLAPALGFVLVVIGLVFIYPLNKKKVEENAAILKERREKGTK
jgi:GPH family glycoside/pentoside/hexuronide:cation symporter